MMMDGKPVMKTRTFLRYSEAEEGLQQLCCLKLRQQPPLVEKPRHTFGGHRKCYFLSLLQTSHLLEAAAALPPAPQRLFSQVRTPDNRPRGKTVGEGWQCRPLQYSHHCSEIISHDDDGGDGDNGTDVFVVSERWAGLVDGGGVARPTRMTRASV